MLDTSVISTSVVSACVAVVSVCCDGSSPVGTSTGSPSPTVSSGLPSSSTGVPSLGVDALLLRSSGSLPSPSAASPSFASSTTKAPSDGDGARDISARGYAHALALPSFDTAQSTLPDFENRSELIYVIRNIPICYSRSNKLTSSDSTFPSDPPRPMSCL